MTADDLFEKKKNAKTDEDWLNLLDDIEEYIREGGHPPEERKKIYPLGLSEVVFMMCDGIEDKRNKV